MSSITAQNLLKMDRSRCCGYGMCADLCPEVFSLDENGFVVANMDAIPDHLLESAQEAAYCCPEEVIAIETGQEATS